MSTFYSVRSGHTLEFRRGGYGEVEDPVLGKMKVPIKPLKVSFLPLDVPIPVYGLPAREGLARGVMYPMRAAEQIRRQSLELGPAADNLPATNEELAAWVVDRLRKHHGLGSQFIEVPDMDEEVEGEALDENLPNPAESGLGPTPVGVIVREKGGRAFCKVCQRSLKPSGINGHSRSNKHLAALREYQERLRSDSGVSQ